MFTIKPINPPREIPVPSGLVILTHTCITTVIDPGSRTPIKVTEHDGYMDGDEFHNWGDARVQTLDRQGFQSLLDDTTGGKPRGEFRTTDLQAALERKIAAAAPVEEDDGPRSALIGVPEIPI